MNLKISTTNEGYFVWCINMAMMHLCLIAVGWICGDFQEMLLMLLE